MKFIGHKQTVEYKEIVISYINLDFCLLVQEREIFAKTLINMWNISSLFLKAPSKADHPSRLTL